VAQDDYYYEIQLTNKQLVFYFMAGAAGLVLSFLAGVMVGRGVEPGNASELARPVGEERVVAEQAPAASPSPSDFSYPQRLESERPEEGLERPRMGGAAVAPPTAPPARPATPSPTPTPAAPPRPTPAPTRAATPAATPAPPAALPRSLASTAHGFYVQVGAFKDRGSADSVVRSLKGRGLPGYVVAPPAPGGGLFTVRVGVYRDRVDAEAVVERLRGEKFQPYIQKQ
jgi:cell division protein FtsN